MLLASNRMGIDDEKKKNRGWARELCISKGLLTTKRCIRDRINSTNTTGRKKMVFGLKRKLVERTMKKDPML